MAAGLLAVFLVFLSSCNNTEGDQTMDNEMIFPKGDEAPSAFFSNTAWVRMLHTDEDHAFDTQVYDVTFEPAARTNWHSHPGGQILLCTKGRGYYQEKGEPAQLLEKGDVVPIPPDVVHWHGAAPDAEFVHIGMSTQVHLGPAEWLGPVTDEEYAEATAN